MSKPTHAQIRLGRGGVGLVEFFGLAPGESDDMTADRLSGDVFGLLREGSWPDDLAR